MCSVRRDRSAAWIGGIVVIVVGMTIAVPAALRLRLPRSANAPNATLVASLRAEPRSFNRYVARDFSTVVVTLLLHDALVRINRVTNEIEPALAESWQLLDDGRTYRLRLRTGIRFSDGAPFSADDVAFSFHAIFDRRVESVLAESLQVGGEPLAVDVENASTVLIRFPTRFGPGLRMLDGVPIYPRHRLEASIGAGEFRRAWSVSARPSELAGLGPFVLERYDPGQRLTFARNPHDWRRAKQRSHPERLILQIVPDQDAELLQLQSGGIDFTQSELRPADVAALKRSASTSLVVRDAGVGLDGDLLWLNLAPGRAADPRSGWLQHRDFRRAIAHSIDRQLFVDTVYFGAAAAADSIVSPGNTAWHAVAPAPNYDVASARRLLASLGLTPRGDGGALRDGAGRDVRFTLLTQRGNTSLERGAAVIRQSLAAVGVHVDVVALEVGALIEAVMKGEYDAAYFRLLTTDTDPALNLDFWLSSGSAHMWDPGQPAPATGWEAEVDALMNRVATSLDREQRREAFAAVQRIMAREVPAICFAFPRLAVATSSRVSNARVAPFRPPVLWDSGALSLRASQ